MDNAITTETVNTIFCLLDECNARLSKIADMHPALSGLRQNDETIEGIREDVAVLSAVASGADTITLPEPTTGEPETYLIPPARLKWAAALQS